MPARRFSFVLDTTQNHLLLSAFNTKNAVSLSLAAQARAWNSLLTVSATLRLLCARRSGLAERRPERRPQTTKPQVPGIKASGKLEVRVCVVCTSTVCMHTRNYTCLLSLSLCDAHSMFTRKKDELERCQGSLGRKLAAGPWLGQFANPRLRKDLTAVQTRGVLTAPTHQSLTP